MQRFVIVLFALFAFAGIASAQVPTSGNVFFGYSYESVDSSAFEFANFDRSNLNGWEASLEGKVFPHVGMVADFGGHYGNQDINVVVGGVPGTQNISGHELTVMFGPRVSVGVGRLRPFAEALFGVGHMNTDLDSDTSFATALGGGVDFKILKPLAWRFQGDYVQTRFFDATQNNVRISTGIVLKF